MIAQGEFSLAFGATVGPQLVSDLAFRLKTGVVFVGFREIRQ